MAKIDFARREPTLCNFSIVFFKVFLPQDRIDKLHKIGSLLAKSGSAIQFLRNLELETSKRMSKLSKVYYVKFQATRIQIKHTVQLAAWLTEDLSI